METKRVEITTATILKFLGIILALILLWYLKSILMLLFVVLIVVASFAPIVGWAQKYKIPRVVSTILIFILLFGFIFLLGYLIIPPLVNQAIDLTNKVPQYTSHYGLSFETVKQFTLKTNLIDTIKNNVGNISNNLTSASSTIFSALAAAFGGIATFIIAIALTFYLLLTQNQITEGILTYIPKKRRGLVRKVGGEILLKLGAWARGQFILCLVIGLVIGIALKIFGLPFALMLGVLAGVTELIPNIGPIIAAIPALAIALTISPWKALIVLIIYIATHQLENNLLVPTIMKRAVGINPAIIIIAILIGAQLAGILGIILAVPTAAVLSIVFRVWKEQTIRE
ncbi:MAG: AI-2E family transporter [Candidatus Falkowbacteria bacterium]|nr:AI-2E family transporter [Candidatus Falkowbacteria bacterium]